MKTLPLLGDVNANRKGHLIGYFIKGKNYQTLSRVILPFKMVAIFITSKI